jgi:hypothetical protein
VFIKKCNLPFSVAFFTIKKTENRVAPFSKINASWIGGVAHYSKKGATHILVGVAPFFKKCATRLGLRVSQRKAQLAF